MVMKTLLKTAGLAIVASFALSFGASAATVTYAQAVTELGTDNSCAIGDVGFEYNSSRSNLCNSLGAENGTYPPQFGFTSTGNFGELEYTFGTNFTGPIYVWEVTGGSTSNWTEDLNLTFIAVTAGGTDVIGSISNDPSQPGGAPGRWKVEFDLQGGPFSALRVSAGDGPGDKFDIDAIGVSPVPLPAAGLMLIAGLGGLAALKRRRKA